MMVWRGRDMERDMMIVWQYLGLSLTTTLRHAGSIIMWSLSSCQNPSKGTHTQSAITGSAGLDIVFPTKWYWAENKRVQWEPVWMLVNTLHCRCLSYNTVIKDTLGLGFGPALFYLGQYHGESRAIIGPLHKDGMAVHYRPPWAFILVHWEASF